MILKYQVRKGQEGSGPLSIAFEDVCIVFKHPLSHPKEKER